MTIGKKIVGGLIMGLLTNAPKYEIPQKMAATKDTPMQIAQSTPTPVRVYTFKYLSN